MTLDLWTVLLVAGYLLAAGVTYEVFMTGYDWRNHPPFHDGDEFLAAGFLAICCPLVLTFIVVTGIGRLLVSRFMETDR
jgi:hypothetical protein